MNDLSTVIKKINEVRCQHPAPLREIYLRKEIADECAEKCGVEDARYKGKSEFLGIPMIVTPLLPEGTLALIYHGNEREQITIIKREDAA